MTLANRIELEETGEIALVRIIDPNKLIFKKLEFWWSNFGISNSRGVKYLNLPESEFQIYKNPNFWLVIKKGKKNE